jgi:hypothetical protein
MADNRFVLMVCQFDRPSGKAYPPVASLPVTTVTPAMSFVAMPVVCPLHQFTMQQTVYACEHALAGTGAKIPAPTPNDGVQFGDKGHLWRTPVLPNYLFQFA